MTLTPDRRDSPSRSSSTAWRSSLGLIVAIGAQNAFVLRQGLRREHVGSVVLFCAVADAALIAAGVLGMAQALGREPAPGAALALAGAAFLAVYGWQALQRARQAHALQAAEGGAGLRRGAAVAQAAAFTLLNPHVYLDTVLLVGSIGAQQPAALRGWFIAGAGERQPALVLAARLRRALAGAVVRAAARLAGARRPDRRDDVRAVGAAGAPRAGRRLSPGRAAAVRWRAAPAPARSRAGWRPPPGPR